MTIAPLLAGAASFAAILGGLIGRSRLTAIGWAVGGFILVFFYSAALGSGFPMGIAHLVGASLLGLIGFAIQRGLRQRRLGRITWSAATVYVAVSILGGGLIALSSGERRPYRGLLTAIADYQQERLAHARAMLRGEAELPIYHEWRALTEASLNATLSTLMATPVEYAGAVNGYALNYAETGRLEFRNNGLYRFGAEARATVKAAFPGDPARRYEFSHILVQGW